MLIRRTFHYFASSIMMMAITFATFPLATLVLEPADYGAFALASAFVAVVAASSGASFNFSLSTHLPEASAKDRIALVSTAAGIAIIAAMLSGALAIGALAAISAWIDVFSVLPRYGFILLVIAGVLAAPWQVAENVLVMDGRAKAFSVGVVTQAACRAAGLLIALFVFGLGALSLFVGSLAGSVLAFAAAALVLRRDLRWRPSQRWLRIMLAGSLTHAGQGLAEVLRAALQNSLIASTVGLITLGLFAHGRQYQTYTTKMYKAVMVALWPVNLAEARDPAGDFVETIKVWRVTQCLVVLIGLFFATLGKEFIGFLSHGKFDAAFVFAALLVAGLLIQTGARPQISLLIANGRSNSHNNVRTTSSVIGILLLVALIPDFRMAGVMVALFAQWTITWIGSYIFGRRIRVVPFSDHLIVLGLVLIGGALAVKVVLAPGLAVSVGLFAVAAAPALIFTRRELSQVARRILGRFSTRGGLLGLITELAAK